MTQLEEAAVVAVDITPDLAGKVIVAMAKRLAAVDDEMPEKPVRIIAWYLRQAAMEEN
ncbi:hypothetical protein UFOVP184_26 [uncultured Caudovirales phage]|uniref:Uncharacterized protein n=1 Tax=uncultured Caudovirales phage TaxID=2100421 RepID=A0A6J7WFU8_9CAUD|nr:hypothetical protein UFOVP184_26 [uncultured Caudovirales phage]